MKLSASVPDELWNEARSLAANADSSSAVIQEALRRWVAQARGGPGYATSPPEEILDALQEARERLAREARAEFAHGYAQGVQCARRLPWLAIEDLADRHKFKVSEWAGAWTRAVVGRPLRKQEFDKAIAGVLGRPRTRLFDWAAVDAAMPAADAVPVPYAVVRALVPALGVLVSPFGDDLEFEPSTTYLRGFTKAMRDIWSSVAEGTNASER